MATTYGDNPREYPYSPQKRKKQKYTLITRVVDFTTNLPITSGGYIDTANVSSNTTAWAAADTLQIIRIRAGQTVLGVQVEILTSSTDSGDYVTIGYGDDTLRWGKVDLFVDKGVTNPKVKQFLSDRQYVHVKERDATTMEGVDTLFGGPYYFSSADTIDLTIGKAALQGKIRLIVHLLEDDR